MSTRGVIFRAVDFRDYDTRLAAYAVVRDDRDRILLALWNEADGSTDEARWIPIADVPSLRRVSLVDAALAMTQSRPRWSNAR